MGIGCPRTLDLEDITGDDLRGLDLLERAITQNNGLEGKRLLKLLDDGTSLELLDETDGGVEDEQGANDTEINPVLKTGSENGGGLHDELDRSDEEAKELEDEVFLFDLNVSNYIP